MINVENKEKCCACGACKEICPKNAIEYKSDEYGNYYPIVDNSLCIECGLCEKVCPYLHLEKKTSKHVTYAVKLKDIDKLRQSASGGAFYGLAEGFFDKKSITRSEIYGCAYDECLKPKHMGVSNLEQLDKFRGSKYVRSEVQIYGEILEHLRKGDRVLFSGTPCQCKALKLFCNEYTTNLYTIELICHGVIDQDYWEDYIVFLQKKYKGHIENFHFRFKRNGKPFTSKYTVVKKNGKKKDYFESSALSYYYNHFLSGVVFRENCYHCPFANSTRVADVTIGDYWGYQGKMDIQDGISVLIVNSDKGEELFSNARKYFDFEEKTYEDAARMNEQLRKPFSIEKKNYVLLQEWKKFGAFHMYRKHIKKHWKAWVINKVIK